MTGNENWHCGLGVAQRLGVTELPRRLFRQERQSSREYVCEQSAHLGTLLLPLLWYLSLNDLLKLCSLV